MPSFERLVAAIERRHRAILLAVLALGLLSGLAILRLEIDMDLLAQLPERSAVFRDYRAALESFGARDSLILLITGPAREIPAFADALAASLRNVEGIVSVRHRIDAEALWREWLRPHRWQLFTPEDYDEIERRLEPEAIRERVRALRRGLAAPLAIGAPRIVTADPLGFDEVLGRSIERRYADALFRPSSGYFLSASGDAALAIVRPARTGFDTIFGRRLMADVREREEALLAGPFAGRGLSVGYTGSLVYALADREILERDLGIYFVVVPVAVLFVFYLGVRTLRILPFATAPLLVTTAITFALSLLLYGRLTMISIAFAGIFYGLGVDSSIYFYATLRKRSPSGREDLRRAVAETLREIGPANVVASTTTAGAFFVIGLSDFTGVSQLGVLTGAAMLLNVAATFVVLPAMIFLFGMRSLPSRPEPTGLSESYARVAERLAARPGAVFAATAALLVLAAAGTRLVALDTDLSNLHPGGGEAAAVEERIHEAFDRAEESGLVVTDGRSLDEALAAAGRVAERLEAWRVRGEVASVSAITTFLPPPDVAESRVARFRSLPRERVAADLRAALDESGFDPAAFEPFLAEWLGDAVPPLDPAAPALAPLRDQHLREADGEVRVGTYFRADEEGLTAVVSRLRDELASLSPVVAAQALAEAEFRRLLFRELRWYLAGALLLNAGLLLAAERSALGALRLLLPTLAALVATLGLMGAAGIGIDPVNVIVFPLILGLGVDATVYMVAHLRHGRGLGAGASRGFGPLVLAVGTTVVGFGSLALAQFPALGRLGLLAGSGLCLSALATLLLVPALERRSYPSA